MSNFEVTMGTGSLCMDNALRNALTVEVCNEIDVMKVCSLHAPFVKISVQTFAIQPYPRRRINASKIPQLY